MRLRTTVFAGALALLLGIVGCGGGGASGGVGGNAGTVSVFVTDNFRTDYDHVWGTIYKVDLVADDSTTTTIFDDSVGRVFDFSRLHDGTNPRFAFLNHATVRAANYSSVRITIGDQMNLIPTGNATGTNFEVQGTAAGAGKVLVTMNLPAVSRFEGSDDLVIDFDLPNFTLVGGKVVPSLRRGANSGLDDMDRHEAEDVHGTVTSLSGTAPALSFDMQLRSGRIMRVRTDASTAIFNSNGTPNPTLAVSKRVEVRGKFDTGTDTMLASSVKIEDGSGEDANETRGVPSAINGTDGTFTLTVSSALGFVPTNRSMSVVTTANTIYRSDRGVILSKADFFTALATEGMLVEVEGTYNAANNTFTARKAKLEDETGEDNGDGFGQAEAKGRLGQFNATAGTAQITVSEFQGFSFGGGVLTFTTTANTRYRDIEGETITKQAFFASLVSGTTIVKGEGRPVEGGIQATTLRIDD